MKLKITFLVGMMVAVTTYSLQGCKKEKVGENDLVVNCPDTISFQSNIVPLINTNCSTSGCHDASQAGGYTFSTHASIAANADIILKAIRHDSGVSPMPQGGSKLSDAQVLAFNCWIQQGKLNN